MKRPEHKTTRKRINAKKRGPVVKEKTNAPRADFLSWLTLTPNFPSWLIEASRKDRGNLSGLPTAEIEKRIWWGLMEMADRIKRPHMTSKGLEQDAADRLAALALASAKLLHQLAFSDDREHREMIGWAARSKHSWPVVLRLGVKRDKNGKRCLEGSDNAWSYLNAIELSEDAEFVVQHFGDTEASIFKRTAELLLNELIRWREQGAWQGEVSTWNKDLLLLELPFASENADKWWSVAKRWMDEQWETNPGLFEPLKKSCKSKGKSLTDAALFDGEIRSRVIDLRLKEAFLALASHGDL